MLVCISVIFTPFWSQARQFAVSVEQDQVTVGEKVEVLLISLAGEAEAPFPDEIICELITAEKKVVILARKEPAQQESEKTGNTCWSAAALYLHAPRHAAGTGCHVLYRYRRGPGCL